MTKPKVAPKPKKAVAKKAVANKLKIKPVVELVTYSIKMVIPTGQYANIQPEIVVKAGTINEAHDFIAPHMNKLWKEYYLVNERRPEPTPVPHTPFPDDTTAKPFVPVPGSVSETVPGSVGAPGVTYLTDPKIPVEKPLTAKEVQAKVGGKFVDELPVQPPDSGVALIKATQAIESCMSLDALELIRAQVDKSVKLTQADKEAVQPLLLARLEHLSK